MADEERNEENEEREENGSGDDEERDESQSSSGDDSSSDDDSGDSGDSGGDDSDDDDSDDDDAKASSGDDSDSDDDDSDDSDDDDSDSDGDDDGDGDDSGPTVSDVMTKDPESVETGDSIEDAAKKMKENDTGALLVVDGDELKGIVTDRDIVVNAIAEGNSDAKVEDVFTSDPATVNADDDIQSAIDAMREKKVRRLPVVDDDKPVGIVSLGDLAVEADDSSVLGELAKSDPN